MTVRWKVVPTLFWMNAAGDRVRGFPVGAVSGDDQVGCELLKGEVDAGRLVIPLSSVTYTELTENPRDRQRKPTADAMLKLSRLAAVAPVRKIVNEELARELNRRFGRPAFPVKVPRSGTAPGSPSASAAT